MYGKFDNCTVHREYLTAEIEKPSGGWGKADCRPDWSVYWRDDTGIPCGGGGGGFDVAAMSFLLSIELI